MLLADDEIDACDGQHDGKQDDGRRRRIRRITAACAIEHVVNIANDGIHFGCIQVCAK